MMVTLRDSIIIKEYHIKYKSSMPWIAIQGLHPKETTVIKGLAKYQYNNSMAILEWCKIWVGFFFKF